MGECNHDCNNCGADCGERTQPQDFRERPHPLSKVKKVIGVVSGKGGVGKSLVTSMLAVESNRRGKKTAILDADITGPSIPKAFGLHGTAFGSEVGIYPLETKQGIKVISTNLLLADETEPVIWRGPLIAGMVKQFWTDVIWDDIDIMYVDMPPGTGDVPLTVFQSIPIDGILIVTSPQELVSMIVTKAVKMAEKMNIPVLGIVENMSYFVCPDCGKKHTVFGESHVEELARQYQLPYVCRLPIESGVAALVDQGLAEEISGTTMQEICKWLDESGILNLD
ncbi:MAG: Mrp/NBP35 family ATP-binding protein [Lachnospiraceae bacterium]|nr:Mrp/NBP35 family ATP-binding protein [Lachnospiraceae bacterium]